MSRDPTTQRQACEHATAGFTLVEALIATALMAAILGAIAIMTAQWLPNWNRGFATVQRNELLAMGLERIVADISAMQFIPAGYGNPLPAFSGTESSIQLVRSALGPNTGPGLEFIQIAEIAGEFGPTLVRMRARYVSADQIRPSFGNPIVLVRPPYRVSFAYAGADRSWRGSWYGAPLLPRAVRIQLRDGVTDRILPASTTATVHVDLPADCVRAQPVDDCLQRERDAERGGGDSPVVGGASRGGR
jgi:general secretion pathway protein J